MLLTLKIILRINISRTFLLVQKSFMMILLTLMIIPLLIKIILILKNLRNMKFITMTIRKDLF